MKALEVLQCPQCGSERVYCDGFRSDPRGGKPIQRYRCADYGHRWSKHSPKTKVKRANAHKGNCRVGADLQVAKNLEETQITRFAWKGKHTPTENEIKAAPQIERFLDQLENDGRKPTTIRNYRDCFIGLLQRGADLFEPENVKKILAKAQTF